MRLWENIVFLYRKLFAALIIVIFLGSTPALFTPDVSGHFTVGINTPVPRFRANDYDRHVSGPIGYVWPGGAFSFLTGGVSPGTAWGGSPAAIPGYQTPYPGHNPPNAPLSWYQLEGAAYAPFGAILTSTNDQANVGDLIFALNFTCNGIATTGGGPALPVCAGNPPNSALTARLNFTAVYIYLPPEFDLSRLVDNPGLVQTSWTNLGSDSSLYQVNQWDAWAPNWWVLRIGCCVSWWGPEHNGAEWWYIRLNQVIAPKIAGRYFFKIFLENAQNEAMHWPGSYAPAVAAGNQDGAASTAGGGRTPMGATAVTVPVQNWPVLLVKGEIDPAIVTGTLRYGTFNTTIYGRAIDLPGRVRLVGQAIDPYDPKRPVLARKVEARGYFNASARGHFEVEGVAPGVYDILASAAGYPEQLIASKVTLLAGQSFHIDGYLQPGAVVHGQVFSKHNFGEEPWPATSYTCTILFDFTRRLKTGIDQVLTNQVDTFDCVPPFGAADVINPFTIVVAPTVGVTAFTVKAVVGVSSAFGARPVYVELYNKNDYKDSSVVAYSPLNLTHSPWMAYDWPRLAFAPRPRRVAFDWESNAGGPGGAISYYANTAVNAAGYDTQCGSLAVTPSAPTTSSLAAGSLVDPCGVHNGVGPAQFWWVDSGGAFTNGGGPNSFIWRFGVKGVYGAPTEIDGHVPQPLAAWVNGLTPGRYWVRVWINGYVQTKADGVTLDEYFFDVAKDEWAGDIFTPTDLRKSSKIVKTVHFHNLPGELVDQPICLAGTDAHSSCGSPFLDRGARYLIAEARDLDGNLKGFNFTFVPETATSATIVINGFGMEGGMPTPGSGLGNIAPCPSATVNTGPNQSPYTINPNADCASPWVGRGFGFKYSLFAMQGIRDYGLLAGTYKVYVYMRGYVQQEFESVTLTLSGSDAFISNHMYRGARFNITLFSIDFERPRVQRPWEFPGARFRVYFFDSQGRNVNYVGIGAGSVFGGARDSDPRRQPLACAPRTSFIPFGTPPDRQCQNPSATSDPTGTIIQIVQWDGWYIVESFGHESLDLSASADGDATNDLVPVQIAFNYDDGFLYDASFYRLGRSANYRTRLALETDTYSAYGYTYGYVQKKDFTFFAQKGQIGDIKLNLMQGVNITLDIKFKRENVFINTPFNMSMRVRVFNEQGLLVGSLSSSFPNSVRNNYIVTDGDTAAATFTGRMFGWEGDRENPIGAGTAGGFYVDPGCAGQVAAAGTGVFGTPPTFDGGFTMTCTSALAGLNSVTGLGRVDPAVTSDSFVFHWPGGLYPGLVTGTNTNWPGATNAGYYVFDSSTTAPGIRTWSTFQTAYTMGFGQRVRPGDGTTVALIRTWIASGLDQLRINVAGIMDRLDPLGPNGNGKLKFAIPKISAFMYGIDGYPNYQGEWTIEVDFTPIYPTPRFDCASPGLGLPCAGNWFPVEGLLTGDSFHVIPGAGFGKSGDSLAGNHLGPFTQRAVWRVPNAHLAAEASVIFEVDKLGYVSGQVFGFTWSDELRTQSWTVLQAVSADGKQTFNYYTFDSLYSFYLPAGTWKFSVYTWSPARNQGFKTITNTVVISNGQITFGVNYYLERSNIPIPEFTATALLGFAALLSSLYITRKRGKQGSKE